MGYNREYYLNNKNKISNRAKIYYQNNKEKIKKRVKKRYIKKRIKIQEYFKKYYNKNKKYIKARQTEWVSKNREKVRKIKKKYRNLHREKLRELGRVYARNLRQRNPEDYKKKRKIWRRNNPDKAKNEKLKYRFNLNLNDYNLILLKQRNKCGICYQKFELKDSNNLNYPCVDHCHKSKKIRGILCRRCNAGIGGFNDEMFLLKKALNWLLHSKTNFKTFKSVPKKVLTAQQFNTILVKQKNKCGICGKNFKQKNIKRYHPYNVDHCHKTGKIRGILCPRCNRSMGLLQDNIKIIRKAIDWLS